MKRSLILCTAAVLLAASVLSCGSSSETEDSAADTENSTPPDTAADSTGFLTEPPVSVPVPVDMGGKDFQILSKTQGESGGPWTSEDFMYEETDGDVVHDAIFNRNAKLEELFNCRIVNTFEDMGDLFSYSYYRAAAKLIQAADTTYDFMMPPIQDCAKLSCENMLLDLTQFDTLHLDQPWWNRTFLETTRIGPAVYYAGGDISLTFMRAAYAIYFNKQSISDYELENPYELVRDRKWTIDKMLELAKDASEDLNGNGYLDSADKIGLAMIDNSGEAFYAASGVRLVTADKNGTLTFTGDSEKSLSVMHQIFDIYQRTDATLNCTDVSKMSPEYTAIGHIARGNNLFSNGQILFWFGTMNIVPDLRSMETDFGILPLPMANEAQGRYYSYVHTWSAAAAAIPTTAQNPEASAAFMEAAAYYAREMITPAYYDTALKTKYARDEDSQEMLDIIYENRWSDLGNLFNIGSVLTDMTVYINSGKNEFASMIESKSAQIENELQKINDAFLSLH